VIFGYSRRRFWVYRRLSVECRAVRVIRSSLQHRAAVACCRVNASLPLMMSFKQAFCRVLSSFCLAVTGNLLRCWCAANVTHIQYTRNSTQKYSVTKVGNVAFVIAVIVFMSLLNWPIFCSHQVRTCFVSAESGSSFFTGYLAFCIKQHQGTVKVECLTDT